MPIAYVVNWLSPFNDIHSIKGISTKKQLATSYVREYMYTWVPNN